jgi:NADH-quinone oxidoreductase subunit M
MPRFVARIAGLSSLGLPGLAGFVAEFNIFVGLFKTYPLFGALGIAAAAITSAYILRLLGAAFFGPLNEKWAHLKDMRPLETWLGRARGFIVMGMWPDPFVDRISQSVLALRG